MTTSLAETTISSISRPLTLTIADFLRGLHCRYRNRRDLKEARAAFMHVVYQEDRMLDDMGVTRDDVLWAASLPIEINAALALRERAAKRRAS